MEFGIGFVTGGLLTGLVAAKSGVILKIAHNWLAKAESSVKLKLEARAEALKVKF